MVEESININDIIESLNIDPKKLRNIKISDKEIEKNDKVSIKVCDKDFADVKTSDGKWFFGQYSYSKDKKYCIVFTDEHGENGKLITGKIMVMRNDIVLWRKKLERPNGAFMTNKGFAIVIDWLHRDSKELIGKLYIFDVKGNLVFSKLFPSNILGQAISKNEKELIIRTAHPDCLGYLFNIDKFKLIKKIKNPFPFKLRGNFNFEKIRHYFR